MVVALDSSLAETKSSVVEEFEDEPSSWHRARHNPIRHYLNNLNDQVQKEELRLQLYALFSTYGKLIDIVALKMTKMRGQAFLVSSSHIFICFRASTLCTTIFIALYLSESKCHGRCFSTLRERCELDSSS